MANQSTYVKAFRLLSFIEKRLSASLNDLEISPVHAQVLRSLSENQPVTASALAKTIERPPTSFTPILDALVSKGYVERQPHPQDRRAILVALTDEGARVAKKLGAIFDGVDDEIMERYPDLEKLNLDVE